ncbi:hypothetical protein ACIQG8_01075 [Pseudarthrobacter oxydans]|uniref:hypothetical protein n=1 Tax=Pseudarthrobacter oxydans TaxID=1671 RepID=UPI0037F646E5
MLRLFRILAAATVALAAVGAFTLINVFGSTAVAAPTTVTLNAAADTYLSTASPNSNFGRAKTLAVSDTTYRAAEVQRLAPFRQHRHQHRPEALLKHLGERELDRAPGQQFVERDDCHSE